MTHYAVLLTGSQDAPRVVSLAEEPHALVLLGADGTETQVAWWRLFRTSDEGSTDSFGRLDRRDWELRVTHGADRELLSRIGKRRLARILNPLRRLSFIKTVFGAVLLFAVLAQHFPPQWTAKVLSSKLQHRLIDSVVAQDAIQRCSHAGGEEAVRKLLMRLDPQIGRNVNVIGLNNGAFIVTAAPANTLVITRGAVQDRGPEVIAALLAHQLSHLRHGDAVVALVRHEGSWGTLGALLDGRLSDGARMDYSGIEERRADLEAMQMLRQAHISMQPAARFFEDVRISRVQGTFVAYDYRDFHYGIDSPAKRWAQAAALQASQDTVQPALDRDDSDALFNFCWAGPIPALSKPPDRNTLPSGPPTPGAGSMLPRDKDVKNT